MLQSRISSCYAPSFLNCGRAAHGTLKAGSAAVCHASTLVVVESPTKAKKIAGFLGSGYVVEASMGHVRQLPSKPGVVQPEKSFTMNWHIPYGKQDVVERIAQLASKADRVLLAPDPDREGEAIAWHLSQLLQKAPGVPSTTPIQRVTFSEITQKAVAQAVTAPRAIDDDLVRAYSARICTDYLLGYSLSPLLWKKLRGTKSAATAVSSEGKKKFDYDPAAGQDSLLAALKAAGTATVESVHHGKRVQTPPLPYTTAKLQQDASRYLGFSVKQTMATAQRLFERGLITYHRTDGVAIADERRDAIRATIASTFADFVPEVPRIYKSKVKNAQEAHDAITVTDSSINPETVEGSAAERKLYELIGQTTAACQMTDAHFRTVRVTLGVAGATLQVSARQIVSAGYLAVWTPQSIRAKYSDSSLASSGGQIDDGIDDAVDEEGDAPETTTQPTVKQVPDEALYDVLVAWKKGSEVRIEDVVPQERHTEPPRRFTEAMLVKELESLGIGRPSTYGRILDILIDRQYVNMDRKWLVPSAKGRVLSTFLKLFFSRWVDFQFTAGMEDNLDHISAGQKDDKGFLRDFWSQLSQSLSDASTVSSQQVFEDVASSLEDTLFPVREDGRDRRACPNCEDGRLYLNGSAKGAFVACSNYRLKGDKQCTYIRTFSGDEYTGEGAEGVEVGMHPEHKAMIYVKEGRYGRYLSMQVDGQDINKSLRSDTDPSSVTVEDAVELLKGPTVLGTHPETGLDVTLQTGRFGPYYKHGSLQFAVGRLREGEEANWEHAMMRLDKKATKLGTTQQEAALREPKNKPKKVAKKSKKAIKMASKAGGTHVHHLWIRDWRQKTGGTLKEGRAAWKALGSEGKAKAKTAYSSQL